MTDKPKILIVDDEELNVELLIDLLEDEGYITASAGDGQQALQLYAENKPDLVLLDVMMPVLDGYATCQKLRELEKDADRQTPIIFISAKANLEDKLKGYAAGGDDYVTKPFDNAELLAKVESTLQKYRQIEELQSNSRQAQAMTFQMMTHASKIGSIGRFLQESLASKTIDELIDRFFELVVQFDLACTLKIQWGHDLIIRSHDGIERPLDIEIIKSYGGQDRIFHFGKNRALFNWGEVMLLVRNVGDEADPIAIMMDGLLAGFRAVSTQLMLLNTVDSFQRRNQQLTSQSARVLDDLDEDLRMLFNEFGTATSLTTHEEEAIASVVNKHRQHLDAIASESLRLEALVSQALLNFKGA